VARSSSIQADVSTRITAETRGGSAARRDSPPSRLPRAQGAPRARSPRQVARCVAPRLRSPANPTPAERSGLGRGRGQKLWPVAGKQGRELVRTRAEKKGRMPTFRSDREERDFWARHKIVTARKPRPSGRGGAPIPMVDCPRLELSTRSASKAGDNQARCALQPSKRRWCWTGRLPRNQAVL
jgi:hypothetical protein